MAEMIWNGFTLDADFALRASPTSTLILFNSLKRIINRLVLDKQKKTINWNMFCQLERNKDQTYDAILEFLGAWGILSRQKSNNYSIQSDEYLINPSLNGTLYFTSGQDAADYAHFYCKDNHQNWSWYIFRNPSFSKITKVTFCTKRQCQFLRPKTKTCSRKDCDNLTRNI